MCSSSRRVFPHTNNVLISRLNKAKELLRQTDMNISQIAAAVGFNSDSNFIHFFSQNTGISPKSFRKLEF